MPWVPGLAVRILTHERARAGRMAATGAFQALVRRHHLAGITITRAIEGASTLGGMRTSSVIELGDDLPLVIEIVDRADRIEPLLPEIAALVQSGVLTVVPLRVYFPVSHLRVGDITDPATVAAHPETPLLDVLRALLDQGARLIPVVDADNSVLGAITLGLLLRQVDADLARHLMRLGEPEHIRRHILQVAEGRTAGEAMLAQPVTVRDDQPIEEAARILTARQVTCAPVVDAQQHLVGLLNEHALTRALVGPLLDQDDQNATAAHTTAQTLRQSTQPAAGELLIAGVLADRDVARILESASWAEVVRVVEQSARGLALVLDGQERLAGIITERALFEHALPGPAAGPLSALRRLLPGAQGGMGSLSSQGNQSPNTPNAQPNVATLMRPAPVLVPPDLPIADALARMLDGEGRKFAVVVAPEGLPLGVLWRDAALRALVGG